MQIPKSDACKTVCYCYTILIGGHPTSEHKFNLYRALDYHAKTINKQTHHNRKLRVLGPTLCTGFLEIG